MLADRDGGSQCLNSHRAEAVGRLASCIGLRQVETACAQTVKRRWGRLDAHWPLPTTRARTRPAPVKPVPPDAAPFCISLAGLVQGLLSRYTPRLPLSSPPLQVLTFPPASFGLLDLGRGHRLQSRTFPLVEPLLHTIVNLASRLDLQDRSCIVPQSFFTVPFDMATHVPTRQPFGALDASRLQQLTSIKNRQNGKLLSVRLLVPSSVYDAAIGRASEEPRPIVYASVALSSSLCPRTLQPLTLPFP